SQQKLQVLSPVALATPIAGTSPSPTASPGAPSPTPSPATSPSPTPAASLTVPTSARVMATIYVYGSHFSSSRAVSIALFDPSSSTLTLETWSAVTTASGSFGRSITLPASALAGNARITACDTNRICASAPLRLTLV
ncbi:MAG: hypothetical protein WCC30_09040, partial [Candidatus Dormiibacterota bacterium]